MTASYSPPSITDVANMAIDVLDDAPIASLDEDSNLARYMARNFWRVYDEVLFVYPWAFARKRAQIAADGTPPPFGWANRYLLPTDCVRPLPPRVDGTWGNLPLLHEVEGRYILMDDKGPLNLVYIYRNTDPGSWNPLFIRILALTLALYAAQNVTGKAGYVDKARTLLNDAWAMVTAESQSAGTPETQNRSQIIDIRGVGMARIGSVITYPTK